MRMTLLVAVLAIGAQACPPDPPKPPVPDSGDAGPVLDGGGTIYERACANLAALGCDAGADPICAATLKHEATSRISPIDVEKCAAAKSKTDVRACGSIRCP